MNAGAASAYRLDNDEVSQVWQVGEYANNESNAYHRDYVFEQSALSDATIEAVFKTKMKATASSLMINKNINTGQTL